MTIVEAAKAIQTASSYLEVKLAEKAGIEKELADFDLEMHKARAPFLNRLRVNTQAIIMARNNVTKANTAVRELLDDEKAA